MRLSVVFDLKCLDSHPFIFENEYFLHLLNNFIFRRRTDVSAVKLENSIYELTNKIDRMSTTSSVNYSPTKLSPRNDYTN